jgi:hypothetical protein
MAALDRDPGLALPLPLLIAVGGIVPDGGRVNQHIGPGQGHQPRRFRVPLVPADQEAEPADGGIDRRKAEIAGGEVELLIIAGVVRDVHLAIAPGDPAVPLQDHRGVVAETGGAPFEQGNHQHHAEFLGERAEDFRSRPGNRLGLIENGDRLALAEIASGMQFLQYHQFGAAPGGGADSGDAALDVGLTVVFAALLDQADGQSFHGCLCGINCLFQVNSANASCPITQARSRRKVPFGNCIVTQCREPCWRSRAPQSMPMTLRPGKARPMTARAAPSAGSA